MQELYRVFKVGSKTDPRYEIFFCPSAPLHYDDRRPYDGRLYTTKQAAYRRCKQLNQQTAQSVNQPAQDGTTDLHNSIPDLPSKPGDLSPVK